MLKRHDALKEKVVVHPPRFDRVRQFTAAACLLLFAAGARAVPTFDIVQLGLTDAEHTTTLGYQENVADYQSDAGYVFGTAARFSGSSKFTNDGYSAWLYDGTGTVRIGLTDAEHTRDDGYQLSYIGETPVVDPIFGRPVELNIGRFINASGQVIGRSTRYNGTSTDLGTSIWLYDGTSSVNIGLTDAEHTRDDGKRANSRYGIADSGLAFGTSARYNGATDNGLTTWVYDGTTTKVIGLTDADHTRDDDRQFSRINALNQAGQAIGDAERYGSGGGQTAWLFDGAATMALGLTGAEFTRDDGYQVSGAMQLLDNGHVIGYSNRFDGSAYRGNASWLYDGASTFEIGLTDAEYTAADGTRVNDPVIHNRVGQVAGYANRYDGDMQIGVSAWFFDGTSTVKLDIPGEQPAASMDSAIPYIGRLTDSGYLAGTTDIYLSTGPIKTLAWVSDGTSTTQIGLVGADHLGDDGAENNQIGGINESGHTIGFAERYNSGGESIGFSAWVYDGTTTLEIGLTDDTHTANDGRRDNGPELINEAGQVSGFAERYIDGVNQGLTAWLYDPTLGTLGFDLSVRDDGFAESRIRVLSDDGVALGYYTLYDGMSTLGDRAFYWSADTGVVDLDLLIDGGLDANGWEAIYDVLDRDTLGRIVGSGLTLSGDAEAAYLLIPQTDDVPSPASAGVLSVLITFSAMRRRRR